MKPIRVLPLVLIAALLCPVGLVRSQDYQLADLRPAQIKTLTLVPATESTPAMPFHLFPTSDEMYERNAAIFYHKAIYRYRMTEAYLRGDGNSPQDMDVPRLHDNYETWMETSIAEMPIDKMRSWVNHHSNTLKEIGYAKRSSYCDWQWLPEEEKANFISQLIEELQNCRELARLLSCQIRIQIADGQYDDAVDTIKACYKLAHDVDQARTSVASLIGVACVSMMNDPIEELVQRNESPSLYWQLKALPDLCDLRRAVKADTELLKFTKGFQDILDIELSDPDSFQRTKVLFLMATIAPAKQWLIKSGMSPEKIEAMPVEDVVELAFRQLTKVLTDEQMKILTYDYPDLAKGDEQFIRNTKNANFVGENSMAINLLPVMVPYFYIAGISANPSSLIRAEARVQRQFAAFQVIEAVRLHLAKTGGLPKTLNEINAVPVPANPETGKPFRFESNGKSATLFSDSPLLSLVIVYKITAAEN